MPIELTPENQAKCYSSIITIQFDPNYVLMDMTNNAFVNSISSTQRQKDGFTYIDSITFKIDALSSQKVRFYKVDETQDYTDNYASIITVN